MKEPGGVVWCNTLLRIGLLGCVFAAPASVWAQDADQVTAADVANEQLKFTKMNLKAAGLNGTQQATLPGIAGVDTVPNFSGAYSTPGFDSNGNPQSNWLFNTLGKRPDAGGTTTINAPFIPVTLDLRNADGSPRYVRLVNGKTITCGTPTEPGCKRLLFDPAPFVQPALESPVFGNFNYTSSPAPTQFADAVARAEYQGAPDDWHTLLAPALKTGRTMVINQDKTCGIGQGKGGHCNYKYAVNADGSCCFFVLIDVNAFTSQLFPPTFKFPPDSTTVMGAAEAAGDITTKDVSTFFFPPAFLYFATGKHTTACCIGGFHSIDEEPGDASNGHLLRAFVMTYSTWDPPIFRDPTTLDVTGFSHEISEIYNDPLVAIDGVHDITPWWLAPNGNCQNDLESGDVVEGLPHQVFPITMPNGRTYHPQNEALLQWFEFQSPSTAINGAYSYPDLTTLTALSAPQKAGCAP